MCMEKAILYEIRMCSKIDYLLCDYTKQHITKRSPDVKDLLHYTLKDYGCPQHMGFSEHYCYVFNGEFYTREQLLQSHPHLFV